MRQNIGTGVFRKDGSDETVRILAMDEYIDLQTDDESLGVLQLRLVAADNKEVACLRLSRTGAYSMASAICEHLWESSIRARRGIIGTIHAEDPESLDYWESRRPEKPIPNNISEAFGKNADGA